MFVVGDFMRKIGKRHVELGVKWMPSGLAYAGGAFCALIYFTDWKVIATKIPIYSRKFNQD